MSDRERELVEAMRVLEKSFISHVDGRDLLDELKLNRAHFCDINVRRDGRDIFYEGDWLKSVQRARLAAKKALAKYD